MVARKIKISIAAEPGSIENFVNPGIFKSQYFRLNTYIYSANIAIDTIDSLVINAW